MRSPYARKQPSLLYFGFVLYLVTRTSPLAFEMQAEVLGSFGKCLDKIHQILLTLVGWRKVPDDTPSSSWLLMPFNGSLSFCLHHQGLERDLEDLGCFFRFFSCVLNGINRKDKVWSIGRQSSRETFRSSKVSSLNVGLQSKNWKRSRNFPDAIFGVHLQYF